MNIKERKILDAAKDLFASNSFDNVRLKDIAQNAGVDVIAVSSHFFNKEFLYNEVFEDVMTEFIQKTTEAVTPDLSLNETIKKIIDTHFDIFLEKPQILIFILTYLHRSKKKITAMSPLNGLYNFDFYAKLLSSKFTKGSLYQLDPMDFIINLLSLISYPFTMQRLVSAKHSFDAPEFKEFMLQRKKKILDLMLLSCKNDNQNPDFFQFLVSGEKILVQ